MVTLVRQLQASFSARILHSFDFEAESFTLYLCLTSILCCLQTALQQVPLVPSKSVQLLVASQMVEIVLHNQARS